MYNFKNRLEAMQLLGLVNIGVFAGVGKGDTQVLLDDETGHLVVYPAGEKAVFQIFVSVAGGANVSLAFSEGRLRKMTRMTGQEVALNFLYAKNIGTTSDLGGNYVTKNNDHQGNGVWFVHVDGDKLQMWEIAIVTDVRGGQSHYYLSLQLVYKASMYLATEKIYHDVYPRTPIWVPEEQFPNFQEWASLHEFLRGNVKLADLRPASRYRKTRLKASEPTDGQARILWYNQSRRYGFASLPTGQTVRLHASQVLGQEFPAFEPGQLVTFQNLKSTGQGFDLEGVEKIGQAAAV